MRDRKDEDPAVANVEQAFGGSGFMRRAGGDEAIEL
jgi:hypothetical protein